MKDRGSPQTCCRISSSVVTGRGQNGGFGLGLYLAKRIATAHGGDLTADHGTGKGARFVLRLRKYEAA
jgi:signal transduction histidine kinase